MNYSILIISTLLLFTNCKKEESKIGKHPEQDILGEWVSDDILSIQDKKLVFSEHGIYSMFLKSGSDTTWNLIHDSLSYSIDRKSIILGDEEAGSNPHKLTDLTKKTLRYEVISPAGDVNPRRFRRE